MLGSLAASPHATVSVWLMARLVAVVCVPLAPPDWEDESFPVAANPAEEVEAVPKALAALSSSVPPADLASALAAVTTLVGDDSTAVNAKIFFKYRRKSFGCERFC